MSKFCEVDIYGHIVRCGISSPVKYKFADKQNRLVVDKGPEKYNQKIYFHQAKVPVPKNNSILEYEYLPKKSGIVETYNTIQKIKNKLVKFVKNKKFDYLFNGRKRDKHNIYYITTVFNLNIGQKIGYIFSCEAIIIKTHLDGTIEEYYIRDATIERFGNTVYDFVSLDPATDEVTGIYSTCPEASYVKIDPRNGEEQLSNIYCIALETNDTELKSLLDLYPNIRPTLKVVSKKEYGYIAEYAEF